MQALPDAVVEQIVALLELRDALAVWCTCRRFHTAGASAADAAAGAGVATLRSMQLPVLPAAPPTKHHTLHTLPPAVAISSSGSS